MNTLLLMLMGCGDKQNETGEPTEEIENKTETETEEITGTPVTVSLTGSSGMKLGLVQVIFPSDDGNEDTGDSDDDGFEFKNIEVISSELSTETSFTFGMETPETDVLDSIDPEMVARIGLWAPFLFLDSNNDDQYSEGEEIGGLSMTWLVYSTQDIPEFNVVQGWGAIEMTFSEEPPETGDLSNIPIEGYLAGDDTMTIGGSYETTLGEKRLAFVAAMNSEGTEFESLYDDVISDPWTVTFSGSPPESHFLDSDEVFQMAVESPMVYTDANGNGSFDLADLYVQDDPALTVCYDGSDDTNLRSIYAVYFNAPLDFTTALYAGMYNLNIGWSIMVNTDSEPLFLAGEELTNLVVTESCGFE